MTSIGERAGWQVDAAGVPYPPEPWRLTGELIVSTFVLPRRQLPAPLLEFVPRGQALLPWFGQAFVGVAFVNYSAGSVLVYRELLVAMPTISRRGLRYTIPLIWVDSPESRAGGNSLWGVPKELGRFSWSGSGSRTEASMAIGGRRVAELTADRGLDLPGRWAIPLPTSQRTADGEIHSNNRVRSGISVARTRWQFDADGPLAFLAGRVPITSIRLGDATIDFGMQVDRRLNIARHGGTA